MGQEDLVDPSGSGDPIRVLIVEDHPGFRTVLRALLESDERLIVIDDVGSAGEALEHPSLDDVDVALVDVGLPGANGIEATKRLRQLNPALRVLIMSGSGFDRAADDALAAGADAYLEKGALHDDLIDAIVDAAGPARRRGPRMRARGIEPPRAAKPTGT
jgi:DNA-binding NarL/FixJ family response regulator